MLTIESAFKFKDLAPSDVEANNNMTVIGFVGYPNVGKSSVINIFMENKRLQVSATPGKVCNLGSLLQGDSRTRP